MMQITEDTPPDMLAGAMDLIVHLPTGRNVKMAVERSTPMMDLLVQITTVHQLQLSNYTLQALGMAPSSEHTDKILPYKPNTPIGTLDTQHIKVVPKTRMIQVPKNVPPGHQPFESTFRLKVYLPRNQLYVTRVSRNVLLEDIMKKVCEEKNLDPMKYEFKHPGNIDQTLDPKLTLSDYQITEIYVVAKGTHTLSQAFSSSDIMALRKEEERKQMHNKTGGGVFNLIFRRGKSSMGSGSISSDTRSISPTHSDDSRSVTPPAVVQQPILPPPKQDPPPERPKPPQRKRRPAPKPPQPSQQPDNPPSEDLRIATEDPQESRRSSEEKPPSSISEVSELQSKKTETGLVICHSRNSSDSSGYHEASVLSENCNTSLPRRPKSAFVGSGDMEKLSKMHSQSTTNLSKMASHSKSTTSLGMTGRKKKIAPPPPPTVRASNPSINLEPASPVVASQSTTTLTEESLSSHQALDSLASITSCSSNVLTDTKDENKPFGSTDSGIAPETVEKLAEIEDFRPGTPPPPPLFLDEPTESLEAKDRLQTEEQEQPKEETQIELSPVVIEEETATPVVQEPTIEEERLKQPIIEPEKEIVDEIDWQYQLPSPPKAFRDSSPIRNEESSSESQSVTDFKDSVVTSPELFEKLKSIEDTQSVSTFVGEEPPLNTLSLENLEKRKSLVYNRELSTSLKMNEDDTFTNSLNKFESTFMEVQKSSQRDAKFVPKSNTNTLPNFKISTYDRPKQKITVFEDDTIRSNTDFINKTKENVIERKSYSSTLGRSYVASSMENISVRKSSIDNQPEDKEYNFFKPEKLNTNRNFGPVSSVFRSESFSTDNTWSPTKPVSRSKSFLTLNGSSKHKTERKISADESMERSNSLYDVSGLQSLGVMRLIQNKLNTPTTSLENLNIQESPVVKKEPPKEIPQPKLPPSEVVQKTTTEKIYKYRGPPSINMGTWSDRPKVPVSVKEDKDYTLGHNISSKLIVNTTNNNITSNNSIEIKNNKELDNPNEPSISIKVNGSEVTETKPGNVVIKIGPSTNTQQPKIIDNQKFISHTTAVGYRKPFTDINKNQRPYSIAFSSEYDISRVPVVRSVELKKPYKDFSNTSVTQIYQEPVMDNNQQNGYVDDKKSIGIGRIRHFNPTLAPTVRGFKSLPKEKEIFEPNSQVPFSQVTLRRTESNKILTDKPKETDFKQPSQDVRPPPPPMMPKVNLKKPVIKHIEPVLDPRDQLLSAIRNFGGKKGLKSVKV